MQKPPSVVLGGLIGFMCGYAAGVFRVDQVFE